MSVRLLLLCVCLIFSSCAPYQGNLRTRAPEAAARGDWEAAYRFAEDALQSDDSEKRAEARQFVLGNPLIYAAAGRTFQTSALQESVQRYGENAAYSVEEDRLLAYKSVASIEDYDKANSSFISIFKDAENNRELRAKETEKRKIESARLAEIKKIESARRIQKMIELESAARVVCKDGLECKKAFALTEIFFSENSDMKIQISTASIIETYNPTKSSNIGLKAKKMPGKGESAEISIRVVCSVDARAQYCENRKFDLYEAFPEFIKTRLLK